jgi:hypothetical protein
MKLIKTAVRMTVTTLAGLALAAIAYAQTGTSPTSGDGR